MLHLNPTTLQDISGGITALLVQLECVYSLNMQERRVSIVRIVSATNKLFFFNTSLLNTAVWAKIPLNIGRKTSQSEFSNCSKNKTL